MIHRAEPSQLFIDTIYAAYHAEAEDLPYDGSYEPGQRPVTVAGIWDQIVRMGVMKVRPFGELFAWDTRRNARQIRNRIADIADAIRQGYVPGMRLAMNDKGREIVAHEEGERGKGESPDHTGYEGDPAGAWESNQEYQERLDGVGEEWV